MSTYYPDEDNREAMDIPPDAPLGKTPVTFDVPVPTLEQVTGEIARQLMSAYSYSEKGLLQKYCQEAVQNLIDEKIAARVEATINDLLVKPIRPTNGFGEPIGEPTSLSGVLAASVTGWANETVGSDGMLKKKDHYSSSSVVTRLEWTLARIVDRELQNQINSEVTKIVRTLKDSATAAIAKQIAEKISGMVIK